MLSIFNNKTKTASTISILEMWWLIASAPGFWGRGPGFESGFSHNDLDALQDHCVYGRENPRVERETYTTEAIKNKNYFEISLILYILVFCMGEFAAHIVWL